MTDVALVGIGELDFSVLAPLGFVSIGAMLVLLLEVTLSRRTSTPAAEAAESEDSATLVETARVGIVLAIVSSVALMLAIYAACYLFWSGVQAPFHLERPMLQLD